MDDRRTIVVNAVDHTDPQEPRKFSELVKEAALLVPNSVKLLMRLARDPRIPLRRKIPVVAAIGYAVSPIDVIPDFLLGVGMLDDAVVISFALDNLLSDTDPEILREHWDGTQDALDLAISLMRWGSTLIPGRS